MSPRKYFLFLASLAVIALCAAPVLAAGMYYGQVYAVNGNQLILRERQTGSEWAFAVSPAATITRNGKAVKLDGLVTGDLAAVTTGAGMLALAIEARSGLVPQEQGTTVTAPAVNHYAGTFLSTGEQSFSFRDQDGKTQRAFSVDDNATITRDGDLAKLTDLKEGDRVKVTTETRLLIKEVATVIEATSQ